MGWQHIKIPAVTTSILILNPAGQTSERQQVNGSVQGRGMTAQKHVFAVFLCAGTHHGFSWLPGKKNKNNKKIIRSTVHNKASMGNGPSVLKMFSRCSFYTRVQTVDIFGKGTEYGVFS